MIDQTFLVKSMTFTLPPIDEKIENSSQMIYGSLVNQKYPSDMAKDFAIRWATMHQYNKLESKKYSDDFAGDTQFTARTLKFTTRVFSHYGKENESPPPDITKLISFCIKSFYWNSYINEMKAKYFHDNSLKAFKETPKDEYITLLKATDITPEIRNRKILMLIRNIQKEIFGKSTNSTYSLKDFLHLSKFIQISDLQYIQIHLQNTLHLFKFKKYQGFLTKYGILESIISIFDKEHTFLYLKDKDLRNNPSIIDPIARFNLLYKLLKNQLFSEMSSMLIGNQSYSRIIELISLISSNFDKNLIVELFKEIQYDNELINFVNQIFPFNLIKNSQYNRASFWIHLAKILINNEIHFSYTINGNKFEFNQSSKTKFSFDLIMNEKENFSLSKKTTILFGYKNRNKNIKEDQFDKNDYIYYSIINELATKYKKPYIDDTKFKELYLKYQKMYNEQKIIINEENSILSLKNIFDLTQIPLLNLIWNIVFTLSEIDINNLSKIIHPLEAKLLLSLQMIFNNLSIDMIDEIIKWSKWATGLENNTSILFKILLEIDISQDSTSSIDDLIFKLNNEINYLKKSPESMNAFWNSDDLIENCKKQIIILNNEKIVNTNLEKELKIQENINVLKTHLVNSKVPEKYQKMKIQLTNKLTNITEFTDEKYNYAQKLVNQFLTDANSSSEQNKSGFINWPRIHTKKSNKKDTDNIKLFKTLIWYSQLKEILTEINAGRNLMKNIWKLNDFEEMNYPREIIFSSLINDSSESDIDLADKKLTERTLNANMINKLWKINKSFITDSKKITEALNNYIDRSPCDEIEIQWIYQTASNLSPDFNLIIPKFEPIDLLYLVVINKDNEYRNGPMFIGLSNIVFLRNMKPLFYNEFNSFKEVAQKIAKITYQTIISPNEEPPKEYDQLKKVFKIQNKLSQINNSIIQNINDIFIIAESLDQWHDHPLIFDDIKFLSENWIDNDELLNRFPSLIFWLCKNKNIADILEQRYKKYQPKQNEIPLWLLAFRMMSSQECIEFDTNNPSVISSEISKVTNDLIIKYLENSKNSNQSINYDWINIMLSNLPQKIVRPNIQAIHEFFIMLSMDNQNIISNEINKKKMEFIREEISKITNLILSNHSQDLMSEDITKSESINHFLAFPSKFIQDKINDSLFDIYEELLSDNLTLKLRNYLKSIDELEIIIQNIHEAINEDEIEMKPSFEERCKIENEKSRRNAIQDIRFNIDKYNESVDDLLKCRNRNNIFYNVTNLKIYQNNLRLYPEIFKSNEGINLKTIEYRSNENIKIKIYRYGNLEEITLPNTHQTIQTTYIFFTNN